MALRQIEVVIPKEGKAEFEKLLEEDSVLHFWQNFSDESGYHLKALVDASGTESFLDKAEQIIGKRENYRLVMTSVEATLPRIEDKEDEKEETVPEEASNPWEKPLQGVRVSREELYHDVLDGIQTTKIYMAMVVLSTIVAALGVLRDNTAVVIGAMVIAPLLGPNVGLALATTLADFDLGWKSLKSNLAGLAAAFAISFFLGMILTVDESVYQIASRTQVHLSDISLALASGAAGVLAYTMGMSAAVIGVMVAVALLPPLVVAGLLAGAMKWNLAMYAFILLLTNVICVNLAAVGTFSIQGVSPRSWYETKKAKKTSKMALLWWMGLMILLAVIIYYAG